MGRETRSNHYCAAEMMQIQSHAGFDVSLIVTETGLGGLGGGMRSNGTF